MDTPEGDRFETLDTDDEISRVFESTMKSVRSVEATVLRMLDRYVFYMPTLESIIASQGLRLKFSRATFRSIAPVVGLDPNAGLRDVANFNGHRARIPNELFANIMGDVQAGINNYGLPGDQKSLKTSSFLVSTLFTRLVGTFQLFITNTAEPEDEVPLMGVDRVKHIFSAFGAIGLIIVQVGPHLLSGKTYYDCVARIIADLFWCHYKNYSSAECSDVYCILCDGTTFHFFLLSKEKKTTFQSGIFPSTNGQTTARQTLKLVDTHSDNLVGFWQGVRVLCESIYYILLQVYCDCADSCYYVLSTIGALDDRARDNRLIEWRTNASAAMSRARAACEKGFKGDVKQAEKLSNKAMVYLQESFDRAPKSYKRPNAALVTEFVTDQIPFM